jgi:hypothetical protein
MEGMMSFKVERLPGEPIVVTILFEDFDLKSEIVLANKAEHDLFDASPEPVFMIVVFRARQTLDEMMQGASVAGREKGAVLHHPNVREVMFVSREKAVHMLAQGLATEIYGNVPVKAFDTLDDALGYARSKINR